MKLDIGCGGGRFGTVMNGDVNIDVQKPNSKTAPFVQCDALHLPFKDCCFSEAVIFDVIEHVENPSQLLKEAKRVLNQNGVLTVGTPNTMRILNFLYILLHGYYIPDADHISTWGKNELENLFKKIGFSQFKVTAKTYRDSSHPLIANFILRLLAFRKDLTERQLMVVAKK